MQDTGHNAYLREIKVYWPGCCICKVDAKDVCLMCQTGMVYAIAR